MSAPAPARSGSARCSRQGKRPMPAADWARGVTFGAEPSRSGALELPGRRPRRPTAAAARGPGPAAGLRRAAPGHRERRVREPRRCRPAGRAPAGQPGRGLRHRAAGRHLPLAGHLRPDHRGGRRSQPDERPAGGARPAAARHASDPGDAGAGPGRRGGHGRPRRGHGGGAGHRAGQRRPAEGGRRGPGRLARPADRWARPTRRPGDRTAHPRWIVDAYADVLPAAELEPALAANNDHAAVDAGRPAGPGDGRRAARRGSRARRTLPVRRPLAGQPG